MRLATVASQLRDAHTLDTHRGLSHGTIQNAAF